MIDITLNNVIYVLLAIVVILVLYHLIQRLL